MTTDESTGRGSATDLRRVAAGGCSAVGPVRVANEDHWLTDSGIGLFVVADGMGGHQAGEVASRLAVASVVDDIRSGQGASPTASDAGPAEGLPARRLKSVLERANACVYTTGAADPALRGMGTTITVLLMGTREALVGSVGDSRAYLVRQGTTIQLTHDDTWLVSFLGTAGAREAAGRAHPMRHVLTQIIGSRDAGEPEILSVPVQAGDVFVLTTDGLHNVVDDDTIGRLAVSAPPEEAARLLVDEALVRHTTDNVTVVVVRTV